MDTLYPSVAALSATNVFEPAATYAKYKLTRAAAEAFVSALHADFGMWSNGDEESAAMKREELVEALSTEIPQEYWFTGREISSAKLLFSSFRGFRLLLQGASKQKHTDAAAINELLKEHGFAL